MYEQIDKEFVDGKTISNINTQSLSLNTNEDRDIFVDALLTNFLGDEKIKEKESLAVKIKYKRHQLEMNTKHLKKEDKTRKGVKVKTKKGLVLNSKLKKSLKLYKLDKNEKLDYGKYEKMHESWQAYASSCLLTCLPKGAEESSENLLNEENVLNCLKQIDYHGAYLTVTRSNSKFLIGLSGIVLQDKKNVFYLLTKESNIKIVPKIGSLFEFELFGCKFTLVGANMCYRPEMRTTKHAKIKTKQNIK